MSHPSRWRRLWLVPVLLAACTAGGLTSALLGDGFWDVLSWLALGLPAALALAVLFGLFRRSSAGR